MNKDFRERAFLPLIMPLGVVVAMAVILFSVSRVLLALPEAISTFTALLAAGYVLLVSALVASRPRISSSAIGVGLVIGLVGVIGAGALAANAGMRELHAEEEEAAEGEGEPAEGEGEAAEGDVPADALVYVAVDIDFEEEATTAEAGELTFVIENRGGIFHNVVIEELGEEVVGADGGQTDTGTVTLEAGTYTYFCDVPGHREAGMEGTLEVS